ncbi:MAG: hypothetical protein U0103_28355 [Candidatus Obscuribacterales bacterium]
MKLSLLILIFVATLTGIAYQTDLEKNCQAFAQAPPALNIEIKRQHKKDTLSQQLSEISRFSEIASSKVASSSTTLKFAYNEPFINSFAGQSNLTVETSLDEVDMPSQLLDWCLRSAVCVPYESLKPLHLLPIGTVRIKSPTDMVLNFYTGAADRFSIGSRWFSDRTGPSSEIVQLIHSSAPIGADEAILAKNFHIDGGITPKWFHRYCLNNKTIDGRAVKVNIEVADHKIKRCSPPYIEQAFFD